ncbi:M23 family metallopeptidase [Streptomyces sp. NRRL S-118]|uniref:M23 family metallopeptidase n=1 Tax=Streptomyces sp. NRRL S-118 TaxID=1463881 RepID=UPI0004CA880F|nr:M23 family metallopeptidase [Streptomyces sp. NRRL S-118]
MTIRKLGMVLYRLLQLTFLATVYGWAVLDYAWWWMLPPIVAAYAIAIAVGARHLNDPLPSRPPVEIGPPVTGRWSALNSPADKTPSHGTHGYGQTYAIDVIADPEDRERPEFSALWPVMRRSSDFPAFGAPLLAVADATVVHATDRQRDHLSRNSLPGVAYLMLFEAWLRDMAGPSRIFGNHLVLDLGDGTYAAYAHLQRDSLTVRTGDRVVAGQQLARCGNSGNSTEPHLHFQLMDGPDLDTARGVPFTWRGVGVPAGGETFTAEPAGTEPAGARAGGAQAA